MPPQFRYTQVVEKSDWNNYHGTVAHRHVPVYAIVDAGGDTTSATVPPWQRQGQALRDILQYCFSSNPPESLRAVGATWSLSDIIAPGNVIVVPGRMNAMARVSPAWFTPAYPGPATPQGAVPMVVEGGARIKDINQALGEMGLALPTSGASDGHRIAGCVATGTHGSAIQIGAVHDTVLAVYLLVAPDRAVLVQPATGTPFRDDLAQWFERQCGFPTQSLKDDDAFFAAQVSLGSMGFVHSLVIETVPLYRLRGRTLVRPLGDAAVFEAVRTFDTQPLHPDIAQRPYHFSLLINPYAGSGSPGLFVGLYWKVPVDGAPFAGPSPAIPMAPSDTANLIGKLIGLLDGPVAGPIVEHVITSVLVSQNPPHPPNEPAPVFPGQAFGPTTLPPGHGESTEIVVDQKRAVDAIATVLRAIDAERSKGRHLLGAMGVRFVPQTRALLGMNIHAMNCYMELGSLTNPAIAQIHQACWDALDAARIPYTCHWGQQHRLDAAHLSAYFGDRVARWKAAREALLSTPTARAVFAAQTLGKVGLAG
jgi:hypothetical protein